MLVLSAKIQDQRTPTKFDRFEIVHQCSCGEICSGTVNVFSKRGANIRIGFDFPDSMAIVRNPVTAENVIQDAIE